MKNSKKFSARLRRFADAPCSIDGLYHYVRRMGLVDGQPLYDTVPTTPLADHRHDTRRGRRSEKTLAIIAAIRAAQTTGEKYMDIAARFGVSQPYITLTAMREGIRRRRRVRRRSA